MKNSWIERLSRILTTSRRTAFVGVGQELRGDDAAGILVLRGLERLNPAADDRSGKAADSKQKARPAAPFLFEAGPLPEAAAGPLRRFGPEWVIFFDAAEMGEPPGAVRWIDPQEAGGYAGSTHGFPMGDFCGYLTAELGCQTAIIGIQPKGMEFDAPLSEEVRRAAEEITAVIRAGMAG